MSAAQPSLLFCAFCEVPGTSAAGTRLGQLLTSFPDAFHVDALVLRGSHQSHIEKIGHARLLRVQTSDDDITSRIAAFQRALLRQLRSDTYDLVYCADVFCGAALTRLKDIRVIVDVGELPSLIFQHRYDVDVGDGALRAIWQKEEQAALRRADLIVVPGDNIAHSLAEDVREKVVTVERAVDHSVFAPPTVHFDDKDRYVVTVFGGLEGKRSLAYVGGFLLALRAALPQEKFALHWLGGSDRGPDIPGVVVDLLDGPVRAAQYLSEADVAIIPLSTAGAKIVPHRALEALACGCDVVFLGEWSEAMQRFDERDFITERDAKNAAQRIEELVDKSEETTARNRLERDVDIEQLMRAYVGFVQEQLKETTIRGPVFRHDQTIISAPMQIRTADILPIGSALLSGKEGKTVASDPAKNSREKSPEGRKRSGPASISLLRSSSKTSRLSRSNPWREGELADTIVDAAPIKDRTQEQAPHLEIPKPVDLTIESKTTIHSSE